MPLAQAGPMQGLVGGKVAPSPEPCLASCEPGSEQLGARRAHEPLGLHLAPSEPQTMEA